MPNARKAYNIICACLCILAIAVFVWYYAYLPGIYYGSLNGIFYMTPEKGLSLNDFVNFKAKSNATWEWDRPPTFSYDQVNLSFGDTEATVLLLSRTIKTGAGQQPFSRQSLEGVLTTSTGTFFDDTDPNQFDALYDFILSAGDGTLPPPRHHSYHNTSPYLKSFTHFRSGGASYIAYTTILIMAIGILLRFFGTMNDPNKGLTKPKPGLCSKFNTIQLIAFANFIILCFGLCLPLPEALAGAICLTVYMMSRIFVPISLGYSLYRRFKTSRRQWDFFGVSLTILLYMITVTTLSPLFGGYRFRLWS